MCTKKQKAAKQTAAEASRYKDIAVAKNSFRIPYKSNYYNRVIKYK